MKEFLSQRGESFLVKNIWENPEALQEVIDLGVRASPTIVIDGEVVVGFDLAKLTSLLKH